MGRALKMTGQIFLWALRYHRKGRDRKNPPNKIHNDYHGNGVNLKIAQMTKHWDTVKKVEKLTIWMRSHVLINIWMLYIRVQKFSLNYWKCDFFWCLSFKICNISSIIILWRLVHWIINFVSWESSYSLVSGEILIIVILKYYHFKSYQ